MQPRGRPLSLARRRRPLRGHDRTVPWLTGCSAMRLVESQGDGRAIHRGGTPDRRGVWRMEAPRLIAGLARVTRDLGEAEELAQEAFAVALEQWPMMGVPPNPAGWLMTTAKNRAIDGYRKHAVAQRKLEMLGARGQASAGLGYRPARRAGGRPHRGRPAPDGVHCLPSDVVDGGAGGSDPALRRGPHHGGDRAGVRSRPPRRPSASCGRNAPSRQPG